MRVYISGPIKGHEDTYRETFAAVELELTRLGHDVVNPVRVGDRLEFNIGRMPTYEEYMKEDVKALLRCEAIYMMKGWEKSVGARHEHHTAILCGLEVMYA